MSVTTARLKWTAVKIRCVGDFLSFILISLDEYASGQTLVHYLSVALWDITCRSFPNEPDHRYDDQENRTDGHQAELDLGQQGGKLHQPIHPVGIHQARNHQAEVFEYISQA